MKVLNSIITVCFITIFAGLFFFTSDNVMTDKMVIAPAPVPSDPDLSESKQMEKRVPVAPPMAMVQEDSLLKNEYTRGAIGAALGWVVKGICEFMLGLLKKGWSSLR